MRQKIQIILLIVCIIFIVLLPQPFPAHLLKTDFQVYWSASHLLAQGENFSDPSRLLAVQQQLSGWDDTENVLVTWNPPWLLVWLIPLTFIPFDRASWLWFLINLTFLFTSTTLLWSLYARTPKIRRKSWLGITLAMLFVPTITTLLVGQITTLVLLGMAGFLYFEQRNSFVTAGLFLSLASIKPHLIYVILPTILLSALIYKQWRTIIGFLLPIISGTVVAFLLRPTFLAEYTLLMGSGKVLKYTPPTLSSTISTWLDWPWFKWIGIGILLLFLIGWWFYWRGIKWMDLTAVSLLISVVTAPYGWSFDVIILLIPLLQCFVWVLEKRVSLSVTIFIGLIYILANGILLYQRSLGVSEEAFFWFPLVLAGLYVWCWRVRNPILEDVTTGLPTFVA